jgi:hypothetical protein
MITNLIVFASLVFTIAFVIAWLMSRDLRAWIERPKHRFHARAREYEVAQRDAARGQEQAS